MSLEHSRALKFGAGVAAQSEETLLERLERSRVLITFEPGAADLAAAAGLITETSRRLPVEVAVHSADTAAAESIAVAASAIDATRGVVVERSRDADFHVHVGSGGAGADLVARPERHGARLSRSSVAVRTTERASGLGVMTCAALASAEAFKHLAAVLPERGRMHDNLAWCPVTLGAEPLSAPPLEHRLDLDFALVGLGAIGTAIVRILAGLPVTGRVLLVDPERFAPENVGTYSIGTAADAALDPTPWKVDLAAQVLPALDCIPIHRPVEELIEDVDAGRARWPELVLAGLDTPQARREMQRLWPDRLIDGATGDTMCGLHDVRSGDDTACLMCLFPSRTEGPSATERLAAATGLPTELLRYGDQPLREEHLRELPPQRRALLQAHVGKPVCGLAQAIGMTSLASDGFMPSVPFVSQQAACLVVGRLLATELRVPCESNFVQHDALVGPNAATCLWRGPTEGCYCGERATLIAKVRETRRRSRSQPLHGRA